MSRTDRNDPIVTGYRLTCAQGCIKPRVFSTGPDGANAPSVEAQAKARKCPRCGEPLEVTAIRDAQ